MVAGGRISLLVGAVGAGVSLVLGVLWGSIAGYAGGRTDAALPQMPDKMIPKTDCDTGKFRP